MLDVDLSEVLAPGVEADEVAELAPLLAARGVLGSFVSLFRGSDTEVLLRLLVLREIGQQADAPRWTPEGLRLRFTYLEPVKFETVLKRLREHQLLEFGEDAHYRLSDLGRNAVAALSALLQFAAEEDAELGFLTAQLAGLQATGNLTAQALGHLLGKLNDLSLHFEDAIASGSEFRIVEARRRLAANGRWLDRGTELLRRLLADPEVEFEVARIAQRIGLAQSRLARVDAAFQRALNKIESQRVTLGASGISSSDVSAWLRSLPTEGLAALADGAVAVPPTPALLAGGHELLDRAEAVLSDDVRRAEADLALPPPDVAGVASGPEVEDLRLLEHFTARLKALDRPTPLGPTVAGGGFGTASYRFSLLALLADGAAAGPAEGPIGAFMQVPLIVRFETGLEPVGHDGIEAVSRGDVRPQSTVEN